MGRTLRATVDSTGRITESVIAGIDSARVTYDADGNPTAYEAGVGVDQLRRTELVYFTSGPSAGLVESVTDAEGRITSYSYDEAGRVTQQTLPGGRQISLAYDATGNLTSITPPGRPAHTFSYSAVNSPTSYSPPAAGLANPATQYVYNRDRQLISTTRPDGTQLLFGYGASGKLSTLTTGRGITTFSYNPATGQVSGIATPEGQGLALTFDGFLRTGTSWSGPVTGSVSLAYNADLAVAQLGVNGQPINLGYDLDGLLVSAGSLSIGRRSDNGLASSTSLGIVTTTSSYNSFGELRRYEVLRPVPSEAQILSDLRSELDEMEVDLEIVWDLRPTSTARTQFNALDSAAQQLPLNVPSFNSAYNNFVFSYGVLRGNALNPNTCECSSEEFEQIVAAIGRLDTSMQELDSLIDAFFAGSTGPEVVFRDELTRDRLGRVVSRTERVQGVAAVYEYAYDGAGRLSQVRTNGVVSSTFAYDLNGNRTAASGVTATFDDQDRLLAAGARTYSYTASGDLLTRTEAGQTTSYVYDALGNLMSVQLPDGRALTYVIDGQNRRVGKGVNGALVQGFLYQEQLQIAAELDGAGAVVSRFVYGTKSNVPEYMIRGGVNYRIVSDHLGSPRLVMNAETGAIVQRVDYDAFGNVIADSNPGFQPFGFAGGLYDRDTRLLRFGMRDYDPEAGRWTSKDPLLFAGGDLNLYGYALSDPINFVDPSGLSVAGCFAKGLFYGALGAAAVGAVAVAVAAVGVPVAIVTAGLGIAAIVGGSALAIDTVIDVQRGDWEQVAFNLGSLAGGLAVGGSTGRSVAESVSRAPSPRWNIDSDLAQGYKSELGTVSQWLGTGPNPASAGFTVATAGAGATAPCGC